MDWILGGALLALGATVPLAWKWQLGVRRVAATVFGLALAAGGGVALAAPLLPSAGLARLAITWTLAVGAAVLLLAYRFYRNPERSAPSRDDVVVSAADGEVIYVRRSRQGKVPIAVKQGREYSLEELTKTPLRSREAVVIGISMSFLDVHVNRAPIGGRVTLQQRFPGRFGSLRRAEMAFENERATTVIERDGVEIAVVQIASRLVRQIVGFVRPGMEVALGQRIGAIRLGSQVDVVIPARPGLRVVVEAGDRVRAGESILAVLD